MSISKVTNRNRLRIVFIFIFISNLFFISCKKNSKINNIDPKKIDKVHVPKSGLYHEFQDGDTLFRLYLKYGVSVDIISKINNIADPYNIKNGKMIFIPGKKDILKHSAKLFKSQREKKRIIKNRIDKVEKKNSKYKWTTKRKARSIKTVQAFNFNKIKKIVPIVNKIQVKHFIVTNSATVWPLQGKINILNRIRNKNSSAIEALEIEPINENNKQVYCIKNGVVSYSGKIPDKGNTIIILHKHVSDSSKEFYTIYAYLNMVKVKIGQEIKKGEVIGNVGLKPNSTKDLLYFEVRKGMNPVNPMLYLPPKKL